MNTPRLIARRRCLWAALLGTVACTDDIHVTVVITDAAVTDGGESTGGTGGEGGTVTAGGSAEGGQENPDGRPPRDAEVAPPKDAAPIEPDACVSGMTGCTCAAGECSSLADVCDPDTNRCVPDDCVDGRRGCPCLAGDNPCEGLDDRCGEQGLCEAIPPDMGVPDPECVRGERGCFCTEQGLCTDGLRDGCDLRTGRCVERSPAAGDLNGPCFPNSTCSLSDDGVQLLCGPQGLCVENECPPGRLGCGCGAAVPCDPGLACGPDPNLEGRLTCQRPNCLPGQPGCACPPDNVCESRGERQYACDGHECVEVVCHVGAENCFCRPDYGCDAGLACDDADFRCKVPVDRRGTIGGPCRADRLCNDPRAICTETAAGVEECVLPACQPGTLNCPCLDQARCDLEADNGERLVCNAANRCVPIDIRPGELGHPCRASAPQCNDGLVCGQGLACIEAPALPEEGGAADVSAEASMIALDDLCYTPCETSFEDASGAYRRCESDGLMEGCIAKETRGPNNTVVRTPRECTAAACVAPGEMPPACLDEDGEPDDSKCPDHQRCYPDGHCASNCRTNADCNDVGLVCHRHVCRTACTAAEAGTCGPGRFCEVADGVNGVCRATSPSDPGADRINGVDGQLSVSVGALEFTNVEQTKTFTVRNESPFSVTVTVHREPKPEGDAFPWVHLSARDTPNAPEIRESPDRTLVITLPSGQASTITVADARPGANIVARTWSGALRLEARGVRPGQVLGAQRIPMSYVESPDGQWTGKAVYFADFKVSPELTNWLNSDRQGVPPAAVSNALLRQLRGFKSDGSYELTRFDAVLSSVETESWSFTTTREACADANPQLGERGYCYIYAGDGHQPNLSPGAALFTGDDWDEAIPKGPMELPFAMNLRFNSQRPTEMLGRIESSLALQYAGNPAVTLRLAGDPSQANRQACLAAHADLCVIPLTAFESEAAIGGRYLPSPGAACAAGTNPTDLPWLVPGFLRGTRELQGLDGQWRTDCRSAALPWSDAERSLQNLNFAGANPVPDGRARARSIELIDGVLINQNRLFIVFRERFGSFLGDAGAGPDADPDGFTAYGYLDLQRSDADLAALAVNGDPFLGSAQVDPTPNAVSQLAGLGAACDAALMQTIGEASAALPQTGAGVDRRVRALVDGVVTAPVANMFIGPQDDEEVHYVCHQTGRFDDCGVASNERLNECPSGSGVTFFSWSKAASAGHNLCDEPCNARGTCSELVPPGDGPGGNPEGAAMSPFMARYGIVGNPFWRCTPSPNAERVVCTDDFSNWREGKDFYKRDLVGAPKLQPLLSAIDDAFRYKTRFRSRDGSQVGFAPQICTADSGALQYCYEPETIEALSLRLECLLAMYADDNARTRLASFSQNTLTDLREVLVEAFSKKEEIDPRTGFCINCRDGFEKLNAELLIMQGDEAFTRALSTRFDLAGVRSGVFLGENFEAGGINLAGIAGYEMSQLHLATQYHQMALDRFYRLSRMLWHTMRGSERQPPDPTLQPLIGIASVTEYVAKLTTASARKAQAWSTIAQRYQEFNEPDLARQVIERTYAGTYLESVIFSRIMLLLFNVAPEADKRQIERVMQEAQWQFSRALRLMREAYEGISDDRQIFGFAPDYIPFPALEPGDTNAFDELMAVARQRAQDAVEKEERAINESRQFNVDRAAFEQELAQLADGQESQLADICGTFTGEDGRVYPAIAKYALQSAFATAVGDPCGLVKNGTIYQKFGELELKQNELAQVLDSHRRELLAVDELRIEAEANCDAIRNEAGLVFGAGNNRIRLTEAITRNREIADSAGRLVAHQEKLADFLGCEPPGAFSVGDCLTKTNAMLGVVQAWAIQEATIAARRLSNAGLEHQLEVLNNELQRDQILAQCERVQISTRSQIKQRLLSLGGFGLDLTRIDIEIQLKRAEIVALRNEAKRLQTEAAENERLRIDVEAARNDPNTRIYKNDAIVAADRTFRAAVQAAYKATKVYEFYTSQSYAALQDLFLVRMVARGQPSLEEYLDGLDQAYEEFQEQFGNPDMRVMRISLRDDILQIPRTTADGGETLPQRDRIEEFRAVVINSQWITPDGYRTIPFDTKLGGLSPLTRVHKILGIEADIRGADTGDEVGRVYVRQRGTSTVNPVAGRLQYFRLPERIAVVNSYFNGRKLFEPTLYRNERLRDRPLVNTRWELVFNDRDEAVNRDIDLNRLDDIVLFVFYTDFTAQE